MEGIRSKMIVIMNPPEGYRYVGCPDCGRIFCTDAEDPHCDHFLKWPSRLFTSSEALRLNLNEGMTRCVDVKVHYNGG